MNTNNQALYAYLLFLMSPFMSLIVMAKSFRSKVFYNLLWLFFGFLGFILVTNDQNSDAFRYSQSFKEYSNLSDDLRLNYFYDENGIDVFKVVSFNIVSAFTDNGSIYFLVIALFYGYFYIGILKYVFNSISFRLNFFYVLLILNFTFILPFLGFKFVRFSTATVVFLYFLIEYLTNGKRINLLYLCFSVLIHFSFLLPVFFVFIYQFLPKKINIFFVLFVLTSFLSFFEFGVLKVIIEQYLPENLESKKSYLNEDYKELVDKGFGELNWYIRFRASIIRNTSILLLVYMFFSKKLNQLKYHSVLCFALSFGIIANIISVVPSGFRFLAISNSLIWFVFTINLLNNKFLILNKKILLITKIVVFYNVVVGLRYLAEDMPVEFFIGNPILAIFGTTNIAMIEFIKHFI
jgi:hypothetical protein